MRGAETDAMGLLLRERIVFLGSSQIDDFVADAIVSASMAIYDVLKLVRADVSTIALGISASTASIILGGGTKVYMDETLSGYHLHCGFDSGAIRLFSVNMLLLQNLASLT